MDLAAVYSRELGDEVMTLAASGWTYDWTFVLYDHQSETMWYHHSSHDGLTGIAGTHQDVQLDSPPSVKTSWREWVAEHPGSKYWLAP